MSSAASSSGLAGGLIAPRGLRGPRILVPFDEATPDQKHRMAQRARKRKGSEQTQDEKRAKTWLRHKRRTRARKAAAKASLAPPEHGDGDVGSEGGGGDDRLAEQLGQQLHPSGNDALAGRVSQRCAVAQPKQLPAAMPVAPLRQAAPKVVPGGAKGPQSFLRAGGHGGPRLVSPPSVSPVPGSLGALRVFIAFLGAAAASGAEVATGVPGRQPDPAAAQKERRTVLAVVPKRGSVRPSPAPSPAKLCPAQPSLAEPCRAHPGHGAAR